MKKDFDVYYKQICNQYFELQEVMKDLSNDFEKGMVDPEQIKQLKKTIQPVENNYRTLSYIKYLLDKPAKKSKQCRYKKSNRKLLSVCKGKTKEDLIKENENVIAELKNMTL